MDIQHEVKVNSPEADFWLIRKHSAELVGSVTNKFYKEHIGIKVDATVVNPTFLYYYMLNEHKSGYWKSLAKGTLRLTHITVRDVANFKVG